MGILSLCLPRSLPTREDTSRRPACWPGESPQRTTPVDTLTMTSSLQKCVKYTFTGPLAAVPRQAVAGNRNWADAHGVRGGQACGAHIPVKTMPLSSSMVFPRGSSKCQTTPETLTWSQGFSLSLGTADLRDQAIPRGWGAEQQPWGPPTRCQ